MAVIQLTTPLILASDPTLLLHPVTKRYADAKISALDAWGFTSGTLNVARIPQFLGDVTKPAGGNEVTLTPSGVVAGTYTKITVAANGRVVAGAALSATDIPALSWGKIVSGKPTTLAGYGITDALSASGGVVTGDMILNSVPSSNYHMVNKNYVDVSIVPGGDSIVIGDVVRMALAGTPTGFLRCNGGKVSKTTYAALYSMIGDNYEVLLNLDTAAPWWRQAGVGLAGQPTGVIKTIMVPNAPGTLGEHYNHRYTFNSFVIKNKVYTPSVQSNGGYQIPTLIRSDILPNGDITNPVVQYSNSYGQDSNAWPLTSPDVEFFVLKNFLHVASGENNSNGNCNIRRAPINPDGTLGALSIVYSDPGKLMTTTKFCYVKNRLYVFDYYFSPFINGGPVEYGYFSVDSAGNLTGLTSLGSLYPGIEKNSKGAVYTSWPIQSVFVMKEKLVILAGNSSGELSTYYATINSDGSLSSWTKGVALASHTNVTAPAFTTIDGAYIGYGSNSLYRLNFDAAGVPVSWTLINLGGNLVNSNYPKPVIVKNRIYFGLRYNPSYPAEVTYVDFTGGLNDYSAYHDGTLSDHDPLNFFLPDFTSKETSGTKYYIKT